MADVLIIRPGCTDFDDQHRIQGELDLPLNDRGREQLGPLVERLRSLSIEMIWTAPCEPCRTTAEIIGAEIGVPVKEKDELCNLNQGLWQGLTVDEVKRKYPKVLKQWRESPETVCPPEGETVTDAVERIRKVLHKASKRHGDVAIVAPEPLATLIHCVATGCKPEMPDSITGSEKTCTFEVLTFGANGRLDGGQSAGIAGPLSAQARAAVSAQGGGG
jgi:probable phosphoglycerate mutase